MKEALQVTLILVPFAFFAKRPASLMRLRARSARKSYRLDSRHCTGGAKDSGEQKVALRQRKTTAPNCEQG